VRASTHALGTPSSASAAATMRLLTSSPTASTGIVRAGRHFPQYGQRVDQARQFVQLVIHLGEECRPALVRHGRGNSHMPIEQRMERRAARSASPSSAIRATATS
jgi:hypothetical protein